MTTTQPTPTVALPWWKSYHGAGLVVSAAQFLATIPIWFLGQKHWVAREGSTSKNLVRTVKGLFTAIPKWMGITAASSFLSGGSFLTLSLGPAVGAVIAIGLVGHMALVGVKTLRKANVQRNYVTGRVPQPPVQPSPGRNPTWTQTRRVGRAQYQNANEIGVGTAVAGAVASAVPVVASAVGNDLRALGAQVRADAPKVAKGSKAFASGAVRVGGKGARKAGQTVSGAVKSARDNRRGGPQPPTP